MKIRFARLRLTAGFALLLALAAPAIPVRAQPSSPPPEFPVEHFFRNPAITQLRFSPSGRYIAALIPHERRLNLVIMDREIKPRT
jgi:hypothetical protein